ncbi:MAG: PAS domain S-box protein, partial [Chloroflexi bacterium]|nr:PAS domain S-box protein [Chloroflexota bacterium]
MSQTKSTIRNENYRIPTMVILVGICCLLGYYYHWVLGTEVVFSHFFYVPIILATVWWQRKGLVVPLFLALVLLVSHSPSCFGFDWHFANDLMRAAVLILVGVTASILSEKTQKAEVSLRQHTESIEKMVEKRTEELRETRDHLDNLIRYANAPIIVWNPANEITIFNQAFEKLSGRTEAEMMGQPLDVLFPEDSRADCLHKVEIASKGKYWETVEIPILRRDGEIRIGLWNSANIFNKDGKTLLSTIAQGQDITGRVQAEEDIRLERDRFQGLLAAVGDGVDVITHDYRVVYANEILKKIVAKDELEGHLCYEVFLDRDVPCERCPMRRAIESGRTETEEILQPNGRIVEVRSSPLRLSTGEMAVIEIARDITERVRSEEMLRTLNVAATAVQRAARTPEAIFAAVMEQLQALGLIGAVVLLDEKRERFTIRYTTIASRLLAQATTLLGFEAMDYSFPVEQLPIGGRILAGETIFVPDAVAELTPVAPALARPLVSSALR